MDASSTTAVSPLSQALEMLQSEAKAALEAAESSPNPAEALELIRIDYLGRKDGRMTAIMKGLKDVPSAEKGAIGALANAVREELENALNSRRDALKLAVMNEKLANEAIDVTMPGTGRLRGGLHPLTRVTEEIKSIFAGMGFQCLDDDVCPELETDYYNFEALNFPADHPARDMQDTYYTDLGANVLLRSQTSNAQIRHMEKNKPPLRVISPGRVYRNEEINSRKFVLFHQMEGLLVDEGVRFSDLKGVLQEFVRQFFQGERPTRFRASFFPFTEPSAEMDVQCILCNGQGCATCGQSGWLEIMGAGMVDPNVLRNVNVDPERYSGFAFGMGIERLAMLKYAINDIRLFFENDLRFLSQFDRL
jgi:phenylalanyl-tRNA synthetase alpha chain